MNKIICILICIIFLTGCGTKQECEVCNYTSYVTQNTGLLSQNTALSNKYTSCLESKEGISNELLSSKTTNNDLKLQILSQSNVTQVTSCTTCTRLLGSCEENLEECWLYNATTSTNCTERLDDCEDILDIFNNTLN